VDEYRFSSYRACSLWAQPATNTIEEITVNVLAIFITFGVLNYLWFNPTGDYRSGNPQYHGVFSPTYLLVASKNKNQPIRVGERLVFSSTGQRKSADRAALSRARLLSGTTSQEEKNQQNGQRDSKQP
jgi:hypothetical protein